MKLNPVVILAGGMATRLRPITENIPKALVEVAGMPFIFHQLRLLQSHGIVTVIISAWYRGEMIRDFLGDGSRFGLNIHYVFDGDTPLGTGGAIRKVLPHLTTAFFVLYGDSYLPCDYAAVQSHFQSENLPALMTIYRNEGKWDNSNVEISQGRIVKYDKKIKSPQMEYIDYGLGMFMPSVFDNLQEGAKADLSEIYQELVTRKKLSYYEMYQRFYEIGSFDGLKELSEVLLIDQNQFLKKE